MVYWNKSSHVIRYVYGFNEEAGNVQVNKYVNSCVENYFFMCVGLYACGCLNACV